MDTLPYEIVVEIILYLDISSIINFTSINYYYHTFLTNNLWKQLTYRDYQNIKQPYKELYLRTRCYYYSLPGINLLENKDQLIIRIRDNINTIRSSIAIILSTFNIEGQFFDSDILYLSTYCNDIEYIYYILIPFFSNHKLTNELITLINNQWLALASDQLAYNKIIQQIKNICQFKSFIAPLINGNIVIGKEVSYYQSFPILKS